MTMNADPMSALRPFLEGWHLTDGNMDAVNAALTGTFPIYSDEEGGTDLDGDTVTMLDKLREYGYAVVNVEALRLAASPGARHAHDFRDENRMLVGQNFTVRACACGEVEDARHPEADDAEHEAWHEAHPGVWCQWNEARQADDPPTDEWLIENGVIPARHDVPEVDVERLARAWDNVMTRDGAGTFVRRADWREVAAEYARNAE